MPRPTGISITDASGNAQHFRLVEGSQSFELIGEPAMEQQGDIAGASRPAKTPRPDILVWRHDDWSGGEGQRFLRSDDPDSPRRYTTGSSVDLSEPGVLRNGWEFDLDTEIVSGATNAATLGFLAVADGELFVFYTGGGDVKAQLRPSGGSFGSTTTIKAGASLRGPVAVAGNHFFVGTSSGLYRATNGLALTTWVSANECENPVISSNRLYFCRRGTNKLEFYQVPIEPSGSAPFTPTLVGTMAGVDRVISTASDGDFVYILAGRIEEELKLFRWDGVALTEWAKLPEDLIVGYDNARLMEVRHGVVFIAGYNAAGANTTNINDDFLLYYITEQEAGTVVHRPGRVVRSGGTETLDLRPTGMRFGKDDRLYIGLQRPNSGANTGEVWVYDLNQDSLSQFGRHDASNDGTLLAISDILYTDGRFWTAAHYTDASGSDDHLDVFKNSRRLAVALYTSVWDFDLPDEEKILLSATIQTESLLSNQYAEVWFFLDDTTGVLTDATEVANTLRHTSGTSTTFTLVDAGTERTFRNLSLLIQAIPDSAGNDQQGVSLTSVTVRATTAGVARFIRTRIDLSDSRGSDRLMRNALTGTKAQETLETLVNSSSNRVHDVKPYYEKTASPYPRKTDTYVCIPYSWAFSYDRPGEGVAEIVWRVIS